MAKQVRKQRLERARPRHYVFEWRKYRGLTQDQLAERIDRSRGLISQFESGETELTEEMVYALAEAFRHTPGDVFRVNPLKEGTVVDITDALFDEPEDVKAKALGYVQGLVSGRRA
jgi:transcriptional regulator with XRE-family HTH domain